MSEFTKKTSENISKIKALNNEISDVEFYVGNETITVNLIKKTVKNYKNEVKTIFTVDHDEFPESDNVIRLYLPIMGDAGYVPTEEEIIQLFQGKSIVPPTNAFISKNSKPYSLQKFEFKPFSENLYKGKVMFYGESVPYFPERKS